MSVSIVRIAAVESRAASHALRTTGVKRKPGEWTCAACRVGRASQQRQAFAQGARYPTGQAIAAYPSVTGIYDAEERLEEVLRRPRRSDVKEQDTSLASEVQPRTEELESLWEDFEQAEEVAERQTVAPSIPKWKSISRERDLKLLNIDYVSALPQALANNEPDMIARCLSAAGEANDVDFIKNIPRTTFAECIRVLQPCNFTEPLVTAHLEISGALAKAFGRAPVRQVAWQHTRILRNLVILRRNAGISLGLAEYKMLLRAAQDLGMRPMSAQIWGMLIQDGHVPDTDCYNHMMAAAIWNDCHEPLSRHTVRVTTFNQERRARGAFRGVPYRSYKIGVFDGLKKRVTRIFNDMLKNGAVADEKSYRNIILAAAREGDIALVKTILRKVWMLDVDALMSGKADVNLSANPIALDPKLQPTSSLIFALAHAFGINNNIPMALRVVDHVARLYNIEIDEASWSQLFEYTFVLAVKRSGVQSESSGAEVGRLPIQSLLSLWETMTSPPYSIRPTMGMYNHLIKNLQQRDSPALMYEHMKRARQVSDDSRQKAYLALQALRAAVEHGDSSPQYVSLEEMRRKWEHLNLIKLRNLFWLKRWTRLLLSTLRSFNHVDEEMDWALREIPRFLWDWRHFAPNLVRYDTVGGVVEFQIRSSEDVQMAKAKWAAAERVEDDVREKIPLFVHDAWPQRDRSLARNIRRRDPPVERKREGEADLSHVIA